MHKEAGGFLKADKWDVNGNLIDVKVRPLNSIAPGEVLHASLHLEAQ